MIQEQKAALRAELRALRAALSEKERARRDKGICDTLIALLDGVDTLLLFYPKGAEIDLRPVFYEAKTRGISCAFPRCGEEKGQMDFHLVGDLDELENGKFGLREPRKDAAPVTDLAGAMIIVPAFSFDLEGHRIGYGGGYYARYLRSHTVPSVGVVYEEFLRDALPHDTLDISVDDIVTEQQIISIQKESRR